MRRASIRSTARIAPSGFGISPHSRLRMPPSKPPRRWHSPAPVCRSQFTGVCRPSARVARPAKNKAECTPPNAGTHSRSAPDKYPAQGKRDLRRRMLPTTARDRAATFQASVSSSFNAVAADRRPSRAVAPSSERTLSDHRNTSRSLAGTGSMPLLQT